MKPYNWDGSEQGEAPLDKLLQTRVRASERIAEMNPPESFEVDEPHSKHSNWEFIEYLSYTIDGPDDLDFLLKMQRLGRQLAKFDQ